ncbi:MAG: 3',5'-cyclic-AMP phosphodiesterase [Pseudomonadota bacterium]
MASEHSVVELASRGDTVRVLQITDTHLKAFEGGQLLGLDTDYSLQAIVDLVKREYPEPDLIVGTGDLADSGAGNAYRRLISYFDQITPRHYWLPGNHDLREVMVDVGGAQRVPGELRVGRWQILMLDSQLPGEVGGHLGASELKRLEDRLEAAASEGLFTLLCLHHQPVPVGCRWLDEQMVSDAHGFFDIIGRFKGVRAVLWGHVHQELDELRDGVRLLCTPSTCVQFQPGQIDFALDMRAPGYRWLELAPDGSIETGVSRAESQVFPVDRDASGYL